MNTALVLMFMLAHLAQKEKPAQPVPIPQQQADKILKDQRQWLLDQITIDQDKSKLTADLDKQNKDAGALQADYDETFKITGVSKDDYQINADALTLDPKSKPPAPPKAEVKKP